MRAADCRRRSTAARSWLASLSTTSAVNATTGSSVPTTSTTRCQRSATGREKMRLSFIDLLPGTIQGGVPAGQRRLSAGRRRRHLAGRRPRHQAAQAGQQAMPGCEASSGGTRSSTMRRWRIRESPHPLDPDRAFAEWGGTYLDGDDFKAGVRGRSWNILPSRFLEFHYDSVHFLGPASFADYLPAFLVAVVRRDKELDQLPGSLLAALTRTDEYPKGVMRFDARIARLTP